MFIVQRVPGYVKTRTKRLAVSLPKIYSIDTGLACALLGIRDGETLLATKHYGALLENLAYLELRKATAWAGQPISLHYFRDRHQREVDLVIERDDGRVTGMEKGLRERLPAGFSRPVSLRRIRRRKIRARHLALHRPPGSPVPDQGQDIPRTATERFDFHSRLIIHRLVQAARQSIGEIIENSPLQVYPAMGGLRLTIPLSWPQSELPPDRYTRDDRLLPASAPTNHP